jgi:Putative DNA-binding domain
MISLQQLQELFYKAVFEHGPDNIAASELAHYINETEGLSSVEHFTIYKGSITASLNRALREIYPVCNRLTGDSFFNAMGKEYMCDTPSRSADLANYGEDFPNFIASFKHTANLPYLADVAKLEWAWHRAFHAADETGLDTGRLAEVQENDQGRIVFKLPLSASLISSEFPILHIWQVNQDDYPGDQTVNLNEGAIELIIWRKGYDMHIDPLDAGEWYLLKGIQQQRPFSELCDKDTDYKIDILLPHCVQQGWIAGFQID